MKLSRETPFRFSNDCCEVPLYFFGSAYFEAIIKEVNTIETKVTKSIYEQVVVNIHFNLTSVLSNPCSVEGFGKIWISDFGDHLINLKVFIDNIFNRKMDKISTERTVTKESEKNFEEAEKC